MTERIVPIFMIHNYILCEGETDEEFLRDLWHHPHERTLLTIFHRPRRVTRLLDQLPDDAGVLVVARERKTNRPLAFYGREDWGRRGQRRYGASTSVMEQK